MLLNKKIYRYSFALSIVTVGLISSQHVFARHHHKGAPPPVTAPKDTHLNPRQSPDDISPFSQQAAENARQQQAELQEQDKKGKNGPPALLPGHYTKRSNKVNGTQGWVNSKRSTGKYDMGINMPVSQTADPTQNKVRGVFRRSMPVTEPNY